jgi:hypothetical protein
VNKRVLAIGLALVAAGCFFFSAFSKRWLYNSADEDEFGFGLRSAWACGEYRDGRECIEWGPSQYEELFYRAGIAEGKQKQTSAAFVPMGWVTFVGCLLAGLSLLAGAGLALGNKKPELPIAPTTTAVLAIAVSLITGCVYVATKPGPGGVVGVGITFIVFGAGVVLGIASAPMLAKVNRPPDIDDY